MRLDYDKEIEIENRKHYTLKDTPTNIRWGGKLKIEGSPKLYVKYLRKRIEVSVPTKKDDSLSCTSK